MPDREPTLDLEDVVITVYAALDDALAQSGILCHDGKLVARPGPAPEVDDREVLCLTLLQELLGFESDHGFYAWFENHPVMQKLFPRRLSRPNWADRRAVLTPLMKQLSKAFCKLGDENQPPFSSSTPTPSMCVGRSARERRSVSAVSSRSGTVPR